MDVHILQGVDALCRLLDLTTDGFRHKLLYQLLQVTVRRLTGHDLEHLLPNLPNLTRLGIGGLANLGLTPTGEGDGEESNKIPIGGFHVNVGLDKRLPLANKCPQFVRGEGHAVEIGETVLALDLINPQLDLAEGLILVLDKICKVDLNNTALERVVGISYPPAVRNAKIKVVMIHLRRPCDLFTRVFPTFLTSKIDGALMSYHSVRRNGLCTLVKDKRG